MTEYKTFDDYVKNTFNIEPRELTHISPEEQKKKTVAITVDGLINIWNELTELTLKAGRPKWHKVADGDLPEEEAEYLVIFESDGTRYRGLESYYPDTKEWSTICNIIAWWEIPKYTEV